MLGPADRPARRRTGMRGAALAMCLTLWLAAACAPRAEPPSAAPPNVIMVVIDTLRADHVGWYGNSSSVSDFLNGLADRGSVFSNAYTPSSWTSPVIASLFTSRYPSQHGIDSYASVLNASERTLAEELRAAGYATLGLSANILVSAPLGYDQGFDRFKTYHGPLKERAATLTRDAVEWIDQMRSAHAQQPLFVYLQLMEAHEPWQPPHEALEALAARRGFGADRVAQLEAFVKEQPPFVLMAPEKIDLARDLYDAEIDSADAQLREWFATLSQRGVLDNALVIVTADHGEEFLEHGGLGHGHTLYNELIHVPLLVALPGQTSRVDIDDVVSLVDLAPTVLAAAGVASPPTFEGHSLLPALQRGSLQRWLHGALSHVAKPATAYSEMSDFRATDIQPKLHRQALVQGSHKLIERRDNQEEAYDLAGDPTEHDRAGLDAAATAAMRATLATVEQRLSHAQEPRRTEAIDAGTRERMRALGYDDGH